MSSFHKALYSLLYSSYYHVIIVQCISHMHVYHVKTKFIIFKKYCSFPFPAPPLFPSPPVFSPSSPSFCKVGHHHIDSTSNLSFVE